MPEQLRHVFTPPVFSDEEQNRLTSFLNIILLFCICLTCANVLSRLIFTPDFLDGLWFNGFGVLLEIGLWFALRRGHVQFVGYTLSIALWLIVSVIVVSSGNGLQDPSFISYTVLIVIVGLILGGRGALVMAFLTSIISLLFVTPESKLLWLNYNIVFVMIAILIGVARHSIFQASNRARQSQVDLEAQNEKLRASETQLQAKTDSLAIINSIAATLHSSLDFQTVVERALDAIQTYTHAPSATLFFRDDQTGSMTRQAIHGIALLNADRKIGQIGVPVPPLEGSLTLLAALEKKFCQSDDIPNDARLNPTMKQALIDAGFKSAGAVPLILQERVVGVIGLMFSETRILSAEEQATLLSIGNTMALAIANAQHVTRIEAEITERHRAQVAQHVAEDKYQSIVENAVEGIFQTTPDGRIMSANPAIARMAGYASPHELITSVTNLAEQLYVDADQRQQWKALMESKGEVRGFETQFRRKDGGIINVSLHARTVRDANGTILYYEGIAEDITERKQHEVTIRAQEEFLRQVIDNNPNKIFVKDWDGRFLLVNRAFADFNGTTIEQAIGKTDRDFSVSKEHAEQFQHDDQEVMTSLKTKFIPHEEVTSASGQIHWFQTIKVPLIGADGKCTRLLIVVTNITQRKRAEEALEAERNLLRTLIDHLPENIYIKDRQSRFLVNNAVSMGLLNASRQEELIWKDDFDFFPREIAEPWYAQEQAVMEWGVAILDKVEEQPWRGENRRWVSGSMIPLRDSDNHIIGILGMNRDITEQKRAEETLRLSEERYRIISELISDWAFSIRVEPDGRLIRDWLTSSVERNLGYTSQEINAQEIFALYHPDDVARVRTDVDKVLQGIPTEGEYRSIAKNGEIRWERTYRQPVMDENQRVIRYFGVAQDITERKHAEEALRESEERYRMLAENIPNSAVILFDRDLRFLLVDGPEINQAGYSKAIIENRTLYEVFPPEIIQLFEGNMRAVLDGKTFSAEIPFGELFYRYNYVPLRDKHGDITYGLIMAQNITERKKAQDALRESEERYRIVSELISDYAYSMKVEPDGSYSPEWVTHDSFLRLTGATYEEALVDGGLPHHHPDDRELIEQHIQETIQGKPTTSEYRLFTKDGKMRWLRLSRSPVWDKDQERVIRFYGVGQDITERKQAEARERELAVTVEREKVSLLRQFLSDASHDLGTPLSIMTTSLYLLRKVTTPEKQTHHIDRLADQTERIKKVIENMFSLSRLDMAEEDFSFARWNLNELVDEVCSGQQTLIAQKGHQLSLDLDMQDLLIVADSAALMTALKHVVVNALNYTPNGGLICLKTYRGDDRAVVEVADNGIGISAGDLPRIFERFYRVDKARQLDTGNSGLGLTIAQKIVRAHKGDIEVESTLGKGSTLRIWLPLRGEK